MIDAILTPTALWKNFSIENEIGAQVLQEINEDGYSCSKLFIEGKKLGDGNVKIYAELFSNSQNSIGPAILLVEDFAINEDKKVILDLLKRGFSVLTVDLAGKQEGKENYTKYPDSIAYANLENSKNILNTVEKDAKSTCWYEWCVVLRYALKYLKSLSNVTKVGGFGFSAVATALWQMAGTDDQLDCVVFALNSGWLGYKGIYKHSGEIEPHFSNEMYKFIAGIDPQSYALHVSCPSLILCATNGDSCDVDRAYDTMTKIPTDNYRAIHYSPLLVDRINNQAYNNAVLFFNKYLFDDDKIVLPEEDEIKCEIVDGKAIAEISVDENCEIDKVCLFFAEEHVIPALRGWQKRFVKRNSEGKYIVEFLPFNQAEFMVLFANVRYKNGFETSTNIVSKRFKQEEIASSYKVTLLYSSRIENGQSIFSPISFSEKNAKMIDIVNKGEIKVKKGPMNIDGICCDSGLRTFVVGSKKYMPINGSMLMLDVYAKQESMLTVKLIVDVLGSKIEYFSKIKMLGGDIWQNVQIDMNKFKTAEGMVLKDYFKINALEMHVEGSEYLINNVLWV